mmetsp:Transcript_25044/g.50247  ORF Transcript_25044/g.50247 Transcript_25044/m.50247 type:complete len:82 (+) Transcript_25044:103-348(+)
MANLLSVVERLNNCGQEHIAHTLDNFDPNHPIYHQLSALNIERSIGHFKSANLGNDEKNFKRVSSCLKRRPNFNNISNKWR